MLWARFAFLALMVAATTLPAYASEKAWVAAERLNRRTCPATNCGIVGRLFSREGVQIFEKRGDWARVENRSSDGAWTQRAAIPA